MLIVIWCDKKREKVVIIDWMRRELAVHTHRYTSIYIYIYIPHLAKCLRTWSLYIWQFSLMCARKLGLWQLLWLSSALYPMKVVLDLLQVQHCNNGNLNRRISLYFSFTMPQLMLFLTSEQVAFKTSLLHVFVHQQELIILPAVAN